MSPRCHSNVMSTSKHSSGAPVFLSNVARISGGEVQNKHNDLLPAVHEIRVKWSLFANIFLAATSRYQTVFLPVGQWHHSWCSGHAQWKERADLWSWLEPHGRTCGLPKSESWWASCLGDAPYAKIRGKSCWYLFPQLLWQWAVSSQLHGGRLEWQEHAAMGVN